MDVIISFITRVYRWLQYNVGEKISALMDTGTAGCDNGCCQPGFSQNIGRI